MATILKGFDRDDMGFLFLLLPATLLTNICTYDYYYYTLHTHTWFALKYPKKILHKFHGKIHLERSRITTCSSPKDDDDIYFYSLLLFQCILTLNTSS